MEWSIVKIGIEQFDMLHAYGLAILLATGWGVSVELRDMGCSYTLSCSTLQLPQVNCDVLLESVFPLPGEEEMRVFDPRAREQKLSVTVLDGLLTALFTTPGPRVLSVSDLVGKQLLEADALQKGLHKVAKKINRWKACARRATKGKKVDWLSDVLRDYHPEHPASPTLVEGKNARDINVLMTLDPSFCFSVRSELSLGRMTEKKQVAVRGTRYAGLLAFIGASRFLRAQRLSGALVNCYVPVARELSIDVDTALPILLPTDCRPDQAALWHWIALSQQSSQPKTVWHSLAYQTLQTQGQQQSLSLESGVLDIGRLVALQEGIGKSAISFWQTQLHAKEAADAQEHLLDALRYRSIDAWLAHLRTMAQGMQAHLGDQGRSYSLEEVRIITEAMSDAKDVPLKQVFEREEGTLRFGRALRQIGRYNPSRLRDLLEDLEAAQTRAQLLPVLHRIVLASELEKAKERKIIVPTEKDFTALSEDIDQYETPVLVGLLLVLSALRYPPSDESLKYELSTLMRALLALAVQIGAVTVADDDPSPLSHELFIDDPGVPDAGGLPEEQEEL
jgi:hypothetical protein